MICKIKKSTLKGTAAAPASKSMAHRYLICAALSEGISHIDGISYSEDILATIDCLRKMGAYIEADGARVTVKGVSPDIKTKEVFPCRESGSTLRFMLPIALHSSLEQTFQGYGRLMERPMSVYEDICRQQGLSFFGQQDKIFIKGPLGSGEFTLRADISSQFITGLLLSLVLCKGDSVLHLMGKTESRSYIDMTIAAMKDFGADVYFKDDNTIYIPGNQKYSCRDTVVEGDYSNAAFLSAFNLIGSCISVENLREDSIQGDRVYGEYFSLLSEGSPQLDMSDCPDLAPVIMTVAAMKNGCRLKNTARLKIKESDRGVVMAEELAKFGADIRVTDNEIVVNPCCLHSPAQELYSHNDHRIAMSLAVISSVFGGTIKGAEAVKKSFPDFFGIMKALSMEVELYDN